MLFRYYSAKFLKQCIFIECFKTNTGERHAQAGRDALPLGFRVGLRFARFPLSCCARAKELPQCRAFGGLVSRGESFCHPWPPPGATYGQCFTPFRSLWLYSAAPLSIAVLASSSDLVLQGQFVVHLLWRTSHPGTFPTTKL